MTNLDSILKNRDITLPTKIRLVKAMVFPVVMHGCESWTIKKAECRRIDAFELWCWRRPLRVPWTVRKSNQSILNEISPGYSLEGLMPKLKLHYFGHLMQALTHLKRPWCWERLKAGREGDDRGWDDWMASPTQWTWVWVNSGSWWWTGRPGRLQSLGSQRVGHNWVTKLNWCKQSTHWNSPQGWERLRVEGEEGIRGWLDGIFDTMDINLGKLQDMVRDREAWHVVVHWQRIRPSWMTEQQLR